MSLLFHHRRDAAAEKKEMLRGKVCNVDEQA
jgi:hypothetical protein